MANKLELLDVINDDGVDYEALLLLMFKDYETKKNSGAVYSMKSFEPKGLIKMYYRITNEPKFDGLLANFKKRYIMNESKLEQVHEPCEIEGLGLVYDYIQSYIQESNINVFTILRLHAILYSKAPYPEFGGKFRNRDVYLPGAAIETESWDNIPKAMNELFAPTNELVKRGLQLGKEKNIEEIIDYIDECIKLNATIIRIHPFMDGNGRTARAFMNLLFKLAGVPPTYVRAKERMEYQQAMNRAINENDFTSLNKFYYYKICDSIYELDMQEKLEQLKQKGEENPKKR